MPLVDVSKTKNQLNIFDKEWLGMGLNTNHELYKLKQIIDYEFLHKIVSQYYQIKEKGRPKHEGVVLCCMLIIQSVYNLSDEKAAKAFSENPYYQNLCGFQYFQKDYKISQFAILRFRKTLGEQGISELLSYTIEIAINTGIIKKIDLENIIADTTVQEKNITYPTDYKLIIKARMYLLQLFKIYNLKPKETFKKFFTKLQAEINFGYKADSKAKKKISCIKKLKTRLGRLIRDFETKLEKYNKQLISSDKELFSIIKTVHDQSVLSAADLKKFNAENDHIYSIHAPETECISKGKLSKKYEFGNKVSIATCLNKNFILAAKSFHGNPYDGHTLAATIADVEKNTKVSIQKVFLDRGYRGNDYSAKGKIYTPYTTRSLTEEDKKNMKRRSAVEASISHLKNYYRMGRNYLQGKIGDIINPIMASIGLNFSQILARI